jgi:ankyrin repeat protein
MVKIKIFLLLIFYSVTIACSQNLGPGYRFDLFKNTSNWDLAKAVAEEDEKETRTLINEKKLDVNLQEPIYKQTLLQLAVGNDKLISTRVLLEEGANVNIPDSEHGTPINEATRFIELKKNTYAIIELLIKYGANVNDIFVKQKGIDTVTFNVPLMGASGNLACAKLLLEHGADPYVKFHNYFPVWFAMLTNAFNEGIFTAKYMIMDKKMPVPKTISYSAGNRRPLDIFYFLSKENFKGDMKKEKAKQDIIEYLRKINFPQK